MNHNYPYYNNSTPPVLPFTSSQFKFTSYNLYHNPNPMAQSIQDHSPRMAQSQIIDPNYGNMIERNQRSVQRDHIRQSSITTVNKSPFKDIEESQDNGDKGSVNEGDKGQQRMYSGENSLDIRQGPNNDNDNQTNNQLQQAYGHSHSQHQQQDNIEQNNQFPTAQKPQPTQLYHTTQKPSHPKQQFHFQLTQQSLSSQYNLQQAKQSTAQVDHVLEFVHEEENQRQIRQQATEMQGKVKNSGDVLNEEISEVKYRLDQLMKRYPVGRQGGDSGMDRSNGGSSRNRNSDSRGNSVNHGKGQQRSSKINTQTQLFIKKPFNTISPIINPISSNNIHTTPNLHIHPTPSNLHTHPTPTPPPNPNPNPRPQTPPPTTFLNMRRSKSINQSPLNLASPPQKSYHPRTQAKITIPQTQIQPSIMNNNVPKTINSLNYSQSIKNYQQLQQCSNYNGLQWKVYQQGNLNNSRDHKIHDNIKVMIPQQDNPQHEELLYRQIHQQEQLIRQYKDIILKLQHQNQSLKSSQPPNPMPTHNTQPNLSTQFHRLQPQHCLTLQQQPEPDQTQKRTSGMNNRVRVSGKIKLSLEQQVEILEEEKKELMVKIEWLNGVVEEMMSIGNNVNANHGSGTISVANSNDINNNTNTNTNTSNNYYNPTPNPNNPTLHSRHGSNLHSRQPSSQLLSKQQKLTQTSFIIQNHSNNSPNKPSLKQQQLQYYKSLYQQQLQQYNVLRQQFNQILQVQDQYNHQFQLILKEIKQIKKGRGYYQKVKKQIKQSQSQEKQRKSRQRADIVMLRQLKRNSRQRPNKVRQQQYDNGESYNNERIIRDVDDHTHNPSPNLRIFQNRVIYQLKQQNTQLLQQNRKLKLFYTRHQAHLNSLQLNSSHNNNTTHQYNKNNKKPFESNLSNCSESPRSQSLDQSRSNVRKHRKQQHRQNLVEDGMKRRPVSYREDLNGVNDHNSSVDKRFRKVKQDERVDYSVSQVVNSRQINHLSSVSSPIVEYHNGMMRYNNPLKQYDIAQNKDNISNHAQYNPQHNKLQNPTHPNHPSSPQSSHINTPTHTANLPIIDRYNNFIKNLKKKFSISSSIIGKEISAQQIIFNNNI